MNGDYITLAGTATAEFTERRSRFIGYASPTGSEEEALAFVTSIRSLHREARHNVYAWRLFDGGASRHSDDGEPQGTGGIPVLGVLEKAGIFNATIVVTRYFGGVLLGAGGLVRAYSRAASLAVEQSDTVRMTWCVLFSLTCSYAHYPTVTAAIERLGGGVVTAEFGTAVDMKLVVPQDQADRLTSVVLDLCRGAVTIQADGGVYRAF